MTKDEFQEAAGISAGLATRWFQHVVDAMAEFDITGTDAQAMFIAQVGHESAGFSRIIESLNYTPAGLVATFGKRISQYQADMLGRTAAHPANQQAIANLVYAGRPGNKSAGDGWKYRGRGLIQVTGLDNYRRCSTGLKVDLVLVPELLEKDEYAARSAGWFWQQVGCQQYADDLERVTRLINGGLNGLDDRRVRFERARAALV